MKIAFLLGGFSSGGIARVTSILVNQLCKLVGYDIHVISYSRYNEKEIYEMNCDIHRHFLFENRISMKKAIIQKGAVKKMRAILDDNKIDILICCDAIFFVLGILACFRTKTTCYCWEHTSPYISTDHKYQNFSRHVALKYSSKYIVLTKESENFYKNKFAKYKNKIFQIYNPIEDECALSPYYDIFSKKIISVGRLTFPKNFERLIRIADKVLPQYPEWTWDIFGDGELKETLKEQISQTNAKNQIFLRGQTSDLYSLYHNYAFFVMTSRYEGFPMSLLEAIANRLPVISFDVKTGPNEIIRNGVNGYLIDSSSDEKMILHIRKMIDDCDSRVKMSSEAYKTIRCFSIGEILKKWILLFESDKGQRNE